VKPGCSVAFRSWRRQLIDLYDYGVYREDQALRRSLSTLERAGWLGPGYRVGITADHGEMLLEHGLWRHQFVFEGNTRIPFLYWTNGAAPQLGRSWQFFAARSRVVGL